MPDADRLVDDLDDWREAICRAAGRCYDAMARRIVSVMVHPKDDIGSVAVLDRSRHHNLFHPRVEIGRDGGAGFEHSRAIDDHIDAVQRQGRDILGADKRQLCPIDFHTVRIMGKPLPAPI